MRKKINESYRSRSRISLHSDLFRKFKKIFMLLSNSDNPGSERQEYSKWYVSLPELEQELEERLFGYPTDMTCFFVGHTGVGKTTVLRHVCNGEASAYFQDRNAYVVHISCDPRYIITPDAWSNVFSSALGYASASLMDIFSINLSISDIANFIKENRGELLHRINAPIEATLEERVDSLRRNERRAYELELLKMVAKKCKLQNLCIIIDDIESLPHSIQVMAINEVFHAHKCLSYNISRTYKLSILVSIRPNTFSVVEKECNLTPYTYEQLSFGEPVDLARLFEARFDSALESADLKNVGNVEEWKRSKEVILKIAEGLHIRFSDVIVALANYNIRDALAYFRKILENRKWFQRDANPEAAFQIVELDYALNDAGVLRALAMPKTEIYFDASAIPVANILHNSPDPESDLIVSYVLRYLLQKVGGINSNIVWRPFDLQDLMDKAQRIFPSDMQKRIKELLANAIVWMVERKLIFQLDTDSKSLRFSLTPRAVVLWMLLEKSSILLQCFREDIYREIGQDNDICHINNEHLSRVDLFLDCVQLVEDIAKKEREHLQVAQTRNLLPVMRETFGTELLSTQLLKGLNATHDQYFRDPARKNVLLQKRIVEVSKQIKENIALLG